MLFSQRKGLKPIKTIIQIDSIDDDLRVGLWNVLDVVFWDGVKKHGRISNCSSEDIYLIRSIWMDFFKKPVDTIDEYSQNVYQEIRDYYFSSKWEEVYDLIEFIAQNYRSKNIIILFEKFCNSVLEKELSAYRFINGKITQITQKEEMLEIKKALEISDEFKGVRIHLKSALKKLSDRKSPDYRNSIKESISAVEAIVRVISRKPKAGLKDALDKIEKKITLHPALKEAFIKLYGYTSDADGIRHALLEKQNLSFEDAKFMLVSCSAFANYLIAKSQK